MREADAPPESSYPVLDHGTGEIAGLLAQIAHSDVAAFQALYARTSAKLLGVCLRILSERGDAEEAVQETYLAIWRRAGSFEPSRGNGLAWLLTVARNCAVDRLRARHKVASTPLELADDVADQAPLAWEVMDRTQMGDRLIACIETLDLRDATLIRAAFYQGSTYGELATRAALPLGTVKSRIRRALMKLGDCIR